MVSGTLLFWWMALVAGVVGGRTICGWLASAASSPFGSGSIGKLESWLILPLGGFSLPLPPTGEPEEGLGSVAQPEPSSERGGITCYSLRVIVTLRSISLPIARLI